MRIILSFIAALLFCTVQAQNIDSIAVFKVTTHSFGKIIQGKKVFTEFSFVNKSDKPLIIETATAECGCTEPDFPKSPIVKGKTAVIKVGFTPENPGKFSKHVTVKFVNIAEPIILTIDGEAEVKS